MRFLRVRTFISSICFVAILLSSARLIADQNMAWPNLTEDEFKERVDKFGRKGYTPIDFEVVIGTKSRTYTLVMEKFPKKKKFILRSKLEEEEFKNTWRELLRKGYRPIDIESYEFQNRQYFGAIWIKDRSVSWVSYDSLDTKGFEIVTEEARSNNQIPIDINTYIKNRKTRYSAVFAENVGGDEWQVESKVSAADLDAHVSSMFQQGYMLIDYGLFRSDNVFYFIVAWKKSDLEWKLVRGLDAVALTDLISVNQQNGYMIKDLEIRRTRDGLRYSGLWIEPSAAESGKPRKRLLDLF